MPGINVEKIIPYHPKWQLLRYNRSHAGCENPPDSLRDRPWVTHLMQEEWGADLVVVHGDIFIPSILPGYIAEIQEKPSGLLTYWLTSEFCEIITLNSLYPQKGIGTR
ncbi:MAG TPA: hypothetical protein VIO61_10775 [Anaerolineaceae bacterium]